MSLVNKGRIELPFPNVTTWRSAGKLLIERIIFQKISNYHFCRPACNRKMFATNDTSQTCGFYHCISQQQNAKPTHNSMWDVNSSLCCCSTTRLNPSLIAANSLTPKGSGHQHLRLRIKRPQVAIVFQRCLLQRSTSRIIDCSPRKMLLSAERFTVARSVLKRFSR